MSRRRPRWLPHPLWLIVSLTITLAVLVPVAYVQLPDVYRWHTLNQLTADDLGERERALNYVIRHAGDDPAVRRGTIDRLESIEDQANFVQMVNALDRAGIWSRRHVSDDAWLRWLDILIEADEAGMRRVAAEELATLTHRADDARMHEMLAALLEDEQAPVREAALRTAALFVGEVEDATPLLRMIGQRTRDEAPSIARHAWILLGLIEPASGFSANWRQAPVEVAEAILWAAVKTNPDRPQPALEAWRDVELAKRLRAMGLYALSLADDPQDIAPIVRDAMETQTTDDAMLQRRRVLLAGHVLRRWPEALALPSIEPRTLLARDSAFAWSMAPRAEALTFTSEDELASVDAAALLAYLEGCDTGAVELAEVRPLSSMLRIAAARKMKSPRLRMLEPAFNSPHATVRDLACIVAIERFEEGQLDTLIASLLTDLNDDAKMSGAILAGLTGLQTDLLRERANQEDVWAVQKIMRVGLWMQGAAPAMTEQVPALLTRRDVPRSTLLMALLHRRHPAGLDYLLAPHGELPSDLQRLLVHYRWWHVLERFLPDDAPSLWLWADEALHRFQIDVLRDWYLLHRGELTRPTEDR
ncbi:MAG: hypothetical protein ACODAQ_08875 [Phycisphaeraceae bacterium]